MGLIRPKQFSKISMGNIRNLASARKNMDRIKLLLQKDYGQPHITTGTSTFRDLSRAFSEIHSAISTFYQCPCKNSHMARLSFPSLDPREGRNDTIYIVVLEIEPDTDVAGSIATGNGGAEQNPISENQKMRAVSSFDDWDKVSISSISTGWSGWSGASVNSCKSWSTTTTFLKPFGNNDLGEIKCQYFSRDETALQKEIVARIPGFEYVGTSTTDVSFGETRFEIGVHLPSESSSNVQNLGQYLFSCSSHQGCTRKERMRIAMDLVRLVLWLHSTPWVDPFWTWQDLEIENGRIFVKRNMDHFRKAHQRASTPPTAFWELVGEPLVTRLGFALVELALGRRLSQMREPISGVGDEDVVDLMTAKRLVESGMIYQEAGYRYHEAVKVCLTHQVFAGNAILRLNSTRSDFLSVAERFILCPILDDYQATWVAIVEGLE
jgi:hypothetical protein